MTSLQQLLITVLGLLVLQATQAQTIHEDYFDGRIYVSLNHGCSVDIDRQFMDYRAAKLPTDQQYFQSLLRKYGVERIDDYFKNLNDPRFDKVYELTFSKFFQVDAFIAELEADPCVIYAEKVPIMYTSYVPSDTRVQGQWTLDAVEAYAAWDLHKNPTREVVIAIVDDAVRIDHEDLQPNLWVNRGEIPNNGIDDDGNGYVDDVYGFDVFHDRPDPSPPIESNGLFSHGTHCAGIASAATDNGIGVASLGYNCKIMSVKAKRDNNTGNTIDNTTAGVVYAVVNNPDVISMSFGGGGGGSTIQNIFTLAFERGILCLSSSGNSNTDLEFYPAAYKHVYSVSSTAPDRRKSGFSNYGEWIDISAPGTNILSTVAGSTASYTNFSGTSMACPNAAGLAGFLYGYHPNVTIHDVLDCMLSTADDLDATNPGFEGLMGAGQINARAAIECLINKPPTPRADFPRINYIGATVSFKDKSLNGHYSKWKIDDNLLAESETFDFTFNQVGRYTIELEIADGTRLIEDIVILPTVGAPYEPGIEGYAGDFEADAGHFATLNIQGTALERANSDQPLKNGTTSGDYAFVLGPEVPYYDTETEVYLYTPLFDIVEEGMYELSFSAKYEVNTGLDGFHLEYTLDEGRTWRVLGTERRDWYNYTNRSLDISAYQLGDAYFTGRQSTFKKFRWNISQFLGSQVAFRFSFNSQDRGGLTSGFAIDDFVITRSTEPALTVVRAFTGQFTTDRRIRIDWTTRPEFYCKGFRIESSRDGRNWDVEHYVAGNNFDIEINQYGWTTPNVRNRDLHFFRLWVENVDDKGTYDKSFYSNTIVVRKNLTGIDLFNHFPNPFSDFVYLVFTDILSNDLDYTIFDISGKMVASGTQLKGQGYYQIDVQDLPPGAYFANLVFGENTSESRTIKLIKH